MLFRSLVRADSRHHAALRQRLVREAQAMARVSHRNVLTVYDAGTVGDEVFIAMELIDGATLGQWLRQERRSWRVALDCFIDAGRGLRAAHAAGLVHRDFKPDNVLVARAGGVYVTDFGLARAANDRELVPATPDATVGSPRLTQTGAIVGTPAYMAPEHVRGGLVDARADQFSFCVALYEALWRERPFSGETSDERLRAVAAGPRAPRRSEAPAWLFQTLARGLRFEIGRAHV